MDNDAREPHRMQKYRKKQEQEGLKESYLNIGDKSTNIQSILFFDGCKGFKDHVIVPIAETEESHHTE